MKIASRTFLEILGGLALILILMGLAMQSASATERNKPEANAKAYADADAKAIAGAHATGGNSEATGGNAEATGGNNALTINEAKRPDDITIRNTASANMPNLTSTAPCVISLSGGLGAAGFNIGGGKTKIDPECNIRETARTFAGLGEVGLALTIACTSEVAKAALGDACGLTASNVYVRVNETVRYVERATGGDTVHDISDQATEHATEICSEATDRAFKSCVNTK
jgi:hypothetical protein